MTKTTPPTTQVDSFDTPGKLDAIIARHWAIMIDQAERLNELRMIRIEQRCAALGYTLKPSNWGHVLEREGHTVYFAGPDKGEALLGITGTTAAGGK